MEKIVQEIVHNLNKAYAEKTISAWDYATRMGELCSEHGSEYIAEILVRDMESKP